MQIYLQAIGAKNIEDLAAISAAYDTVHRSYHSFAPPPGYPARDEFNNRLERVGNSVDRKPLLPEEPKASDIALHAEVSESERVRGRGRVSRETYLYELGILMSYPHAYEVTFGDADEIRVNVSWEIQNGRHRSLTLKGLGTDYIQGSGADEWIKVERET